MKRPQIWQRYEPAGFGFRIRERDENLDLEAPWQPPALFAIIIAQTPALCSSRIYHKSSSFLENRYPPPRRCGLRSRCIVSHACIRAELLHRLFAKIHHPDDFEKLFSTSQRTHEKCVFNFSC